MSDVDAGDDDISPWERDDWTSSDDAPQFDALTRPDRNPAPTTPVPPVIGSGDRRLERPAATDAGVPCRCGRHRIPRVRRSCDASSAATAPNRPPRPTASTRRTASTTTTPASPTTELVTATTAPPDGTTVVAPAAAVVGEAAAWTESSIVVPPPLQTVGAPTELVTLTDNRVLQRIELPSGRVRRLDVASWGENLNIAVSDDSIAVYDGRYVAIIRGTEAIRLFEIPDGVLFVEAWPATGSFVVTSNGPSTGEAERFVMNAVDGSLQPVTPEVTGALVFGAGNFLSNGDLLVNRPGGVYAIGPDQQARRISDGDLLAVGRNHYAIETCDESLQCEQFVIEAASGARSAALLGALNRMGVVDPSTRIAPDGRSIVAADSTRDTGTRQIIDTTTGSRTEVGRLAALYYPDPWAADGSGLFVEDAGVVRFQVASIGEGATLDGIGVTESLMVRPAVGP